MKNTFFSGSFAFVAFNFGKYRYTDNRAGAPFHYLAVMLEGWCRIVSDSGEITANEGDAFYIPMSLPYQSYWHSPGSVRFLSYGFSYFPGAVDYDLQTLGGDAPALIKSIPLGDEPDAAALGRMYTVLGLLTPRMKPAQESAAQHLVRLATDCMAHDMRLPMADIARQCYVSETTLYAAFRQAGGMTPNDMRQRILVDKAVKLLMTTSFSVQQISDRLGFSSTDYFRRVLKKHTGMTPMQIRKGAKPI